MAFRASSLLPQNGLNEAKGLALSVQSLSASRSTQFQNDTNADVVLATFQDLRRRRDALLTISTIPGMAQYARDQEDDQSYDVVAEFAAMVALIDAVLANIIATFPTDADDFLLEKKFAPDGTYTFRTFTGAQLAVLRGLLDDLVAGIV